MNVRSVLIATALLTSLAILHAEAPDTPLEKQMQTLARGMKKLSLQVSNPAKQQETLTLIESLKKAATEAKGLDPRKTASVPQSSQEKFLTAYRVELDKLLESFSQTEAAIQAAQYDKATSLLSTLRGIEKEGHSKFKQD
jgi:soluble cytochrome b562